MRVIKMNLLELDALIKAFKDEQKAGTFIDNSKIIAFYEAKRRDLLSEIKRKVKEALSINN